MNRTQLPFLVEGILILATILVGYFLGKKGKPYGKVKLVIHIFFYLWFTMGFVFIARALYTAKTATVIWDPVIIMGLAILTQLVTGTVMLASKKVGKTLTAIHVTSAILLLLSDVCAFFIAGSH